MELHQLRCFVAAAEELHFGRAAQRLGMLPAALGRHLRLLEDDLGTRLLARTTRSVALTAAGATLLEEARGLLAAADRVAAQIRGQARSHAAVLRVGAIDTASAGLLPLLLKDFRAQRPDIAVELTEDKSFRLLPRLLSGRLDLAFLRPPEHRDKRLAFELLFHETAVAAVPARHALGARRKIAVADLVGAPLIVPDRRSRPHSHDLTTHLFADAGLRPTIAQVAEEKQTIVNLVAAGIGLAIVPRWTSRMAVPGVRYVPLETAGAASATSLPLAAVWLAGARDAVRDDMLTALRGKLADYARRA
jgi:DNA-binding transcriptional LysR family regulator